MWAGHYAEALKEFAAIQTSTKLPQDYGPRYVYNLAYTQYRLGLMADAQRVIEKEHAPDGYNIGVNVGKAGGQSRMHVHVHLIPRYEGDVPNPQGGIRCVLAGKARGA